MNISTLATSEATFTAGAIPRRVIRNILNSYGDTITWAEYGTWKKSEFILTLDCVNSWSARDDIAEFIEEREARAARR